MILGWEKKCNAGKSLQIELQKEMALINGCENNSSVGAEGP
jgi:hypothetical protein